MNYSAYNYYSDGSDLAMSFNDFEVSLSQIDLEKDDVTDLMRRSQRRKKQIDKLIMDLEKQFGDFDTDFQD